MKKRMWVLIIAVAVVVIFLLQAGIYYFVMHNRALDSRPIILIQNPLGGDVLVTGEQVYVHATSSSETGIESIELWVDDLLVDQKETPQGGTYTMLALSSQWVPSSLGSHTLTVRSRSTDGVTGQASVGVNVTSEISETYVVGVGETLDSVAQFYDLSAEELAEMNGGMTAEQVQEGEKLRVPGGYSGPSIEVPTDGAPEDIPPAGGDPAGSLSTLDIVWPLETLQVAVEPTQLKMEVLTLSTRTTFEGLHCYVGLAGNPARWLPDEDNNQTTDESFASIGGTSWNVASHLAGEHALSLFWDGNESVPIDVSCVGITGGGTDSVRLGSVNQSVRPENWGIIQHATSLGGEGSFSLSYRVTWPQKGLDTSITPPWNVQLDESTGELKWDYLPNENGHPVVDGFAILLNDAFQWTVTGSIRKARLPEQWFNLPCGDEYRFQVVAFNDGYPSGSYSLPSNTAIISGEDPGSAGCEISVMVTLETLHTGNLEGNPSPVTGVFFANDQQVTFDGRSVEDDNFPSTFGLERNSTYYISQVLRGYGSGSNQFLVEIPEGRPGIIEFPVVIGFEIYKGSNKVCSGDEFISDDTLASEIHDEIETDRPAGSLPDWCVVDYSITPVRDAPVVDPGAPPPLPDIIVENLSVDPSSGRTRIHVRNVGQATWTNQTIVARVSWPDGEVIGDFEWPNSTLAPGETRILSHGGLNVEPALGVCVLLDPDDRVMEEYDRLVEAGIVSQKAPYCRPQPDLSVAEASFNRDSNNLEIVVQNRGETTLTDADDDGSLDHANLTVWLEFADGRPLSKVYEDINLGAREIMTLDWAIGSGERDRMRNGYTIHLNPDGAIAEKDLSNNSYMVGETARLRLVWMAGHATFCPTNRFLLRGENVSGKNTWDMELYATVQGGGESQVVADWTSPEFEVHWDDPQGEAWCSQFVSDWFEVAGDEKLEIIRTADLDIVGKGFRWFSGGGESLTNYNGFGGTTMAAADTSEACFVDGLQYIRPIMGMDVLGTGVCGPVTCSGLSEEGIRMLGPIEASSEDITGYCWWSTTYRLFKEE